MAAATVTLVTTSLITGFALLIAIDLPWSASDKVAAAGVVLAGGTALLAALGGLIAVAAYAAATSLPDLEVEVLFRFSFPNRPVLQVEKPDTFGMVVLTPFRQCEAQVLIHNRANASARNPAIRLQLVGMGGISGAPGWTPTDFVNTVGPTAVQWDGGADHPIHGRWTKVLPTLDFVGVMAFKNAEAALVLDLVAEGFRSETRVTVELLDADAYGLYSQERADHFKTQDSV